MTDKNKIRKINHLYGLIGAVVLTGTIASIAVPRLENRFEKEHLAKGYVIPSELEITTEDLDKNGKRETVAKYNGKKYLVVLDSLGNPRFQEYRIKSAEIVPKY